MTARRESDGVRRGRLSPLGLLRATALVVQVGAAACGGGGDDGGSVAPTCTFEGASVTPTSPSVVAGDSVRVTATVTTRGSCPTSATVTWQTSDPTIATISRSDASGATVVGVSPGAATITITARVGTDSRTATLTVTVTSPVATVEVSGPSTSVRVGATLQLTAVAKNTAGATVQRPVTWVSSDPARATVSTLGLVTGVSAGGPVTITATSDGKSGTMAITVTAVVARVDVTPPTSTITTGATAPLTAVTRDAQGNALTGRQVTWQSANTAIATVSNAGVVTAVAVGGPITITATSEGVSGTASVTVIAPPTSTPRMAYALVGVPPSGTSNVTLTYSSETGSISAVRLGTGRYDVTFPGQATPAGKATTVLVSAFGSGPAHCKVEGWRNAGTALTATVACFNRTAFTDIEFTILLLGDGALPGRFAFAHADQATASGAYAPPAAAVFSSSGQSISVSRSAAGTYSVSVPGLARTSANSPEIVLATATGTSPARCSIPTDVAPLGGAQIPVHCTNPAATSVESMDSPFVVALIERGRPGLRFGFAYNGNAIDESYVTTTLPPAQAYNSAGSAVTQTHTTEGTYEIRFAGLGRSGTDVVEHVQVTSSSGNGDYCKVQSWTSVGADLVVQVRCIESDTLLPEDQDFTLLVIK